MTLPEFSARFRSKCPGCGEQIEEGDPIFMVDDEWVDESCASESDEWKEETPDAPEVHQVYEIDDPGLFGVG